MVFSRFFDFHAISPITVAVTRHGCRVLATVVLLGLAACATTPGGDRPKPAATVTAPGAAPTTPEAKQALVTRRATERWNLLIKDDLDGAYLYMSPGSREVTSLDRYKLNTRRNAFREIKINSVVCDGDACTVSLMLTYDHQKMKGIVTPVSESWIVDGAQAWYVYGR